MNDVLVFDEQGSDTSARLTYGENHPHACGKKPHACGVAINMAGLRQYLIERHPLKTAEWVSGETGVPVKTVERWLSGNPSEPNAINMMRLFITYRAPFLSAALVNCPDWLNDQAIEAKNAELDQRIAEARAEKIRARP